MSRVGLARRIASAFDTSVSRAQRMIDDLGEPQARAVVRQQESAITRSQGAGRRLPVSNRALAAGGAAGALGGGALLWRREGRLADEAEAERAQAFEDSVSEILKNEDLPAEIASEMTGQAAFATQGEYPDDGSGGFSDLIPSAPDLGLGDSTRFLLFVIVVLAAVYLVMSDEGPNISLASPTGSANGGGANGTA